MISFDAVVAASCLDFSELTSNLLEINLQICGFVERWIEAVCLDRSGVLALVPRPHAHLDVGIGLAIAVHWREVSGVKHGHQERIIASARQFSSEKTK